jgi:hypothetical protein
MYLSLVKPRSRPSINVGLPSRTDQSRVKRETEQRIPSQGFMKDKRLGKLDVTYFLLFFPSSFPGLGLLSRGRHILAAVESFTTKSMNQGKV